MGNSPSVEAPRRGLKNTQKLSKSQTANPATAGSSNPNGNNELKLPSFVTRRLSLPYGSTPAPSPKLPTTTDEAMVALPDLAQDSEPGDRSSRALFRSTSSQDATKQHQRSRSVGVSVSAKGRRRLSRTNSVYATSNQSFEYEYIRDKIEGSVSVNTSRISINYDMFSYESKRLLNLAEEPPNEDTSIASESQFHVSVSRRQSVSNAQLPPSDAVPPLPRNNSDVSLYAPMRRRSLMTPGVATRAPSLHEPLPQKSRYSLPPTPARRDSLDISGNNMLPVPAFNVDAESIPRALTPCEAEYQQTGAFKLGTLRIMNGSPVQSPAVELPQDADARDSNGNAGVQGYFKLGRGLNDDPTLNTRRYMARSTRPGQIMTDTSRMAGGADEATANKAVTQPAALADFSVPMYSNLPESTSPQLQTTSKNTAVEDDLFEEDHFEFSAEILDVRIDPSAKSNPARSDDAVRLNLKDIDRSDSGIVASPTSDSAHKLLSKADSGYSSNVSLRSFQSKPNGREKDRAVAVDAEHSSYGPIEATAAANMARYQSEAPSVTQDHHEGEAPPSVPIKDARFTLPSQRDRPKDLSPSHRNFWPQSGMLSPKKKETVLENSKDCDGKMSESSPLSPTGSTSSASALSIATAPRKSGKLQRLLSSARAPLTAHVTHPSDKAGVPPVPQDIQEKLHEHSGLLPMPFRKFALRSEASKETLGTIMSVGSAEVAHEVDQPTLQQLREDLAKAHAKAQAKENTTDDRRTTGPMQSIGATITRAASSMLVKKPTIHKPVQSPIKSVDQQSISRAEPALPENHQTRSRALRRQSYAGEPPDSTFLAAASERQTYFAPTYTAGRSFTMSTQEKGYLDWRLASTGQSDVKRSNKSSLTLLDPRAIPDRLGPSKTPPPVSMRTRNLGTLRVPPPLRARSTPPRASRKSAEPSLSRKSSREGIYSYPPASDPFFSQKSSLSRQSSRENIMSYPSSKPQARYRAPPPWMTSVDNGRTTSFYTPSGEHRVPKWSVQTDHEPLSVSRATSASNSRRNSLTSQSSQYSQRSVPARPGWSQFNQPPAMQGFPTLTGTVDAPEEDYGRDNGPYPSMPCANGQAYVTDPRSGMPMRQSSTRVPQQFPRGHSRHRSLDQSGQPVPYRVLHSYNSPAYRNVPIWG
ncbi:hypothetical protein F5Y15DRAFT_251510 [Xylariaceae sp. FL0016]|nr:hypothetical protein F5Y15DRAFT_251510 [Xylariaceae sp. FL0016]